MEKSELDQLKPFLPAGEYGALRQAINGEEGAAIRQLCADQVALIAAMPVTYQQDGKGDAAIAYLHYFFGGSDWFITEKDKLGDGRAQAYGFAVLNGDTDNAEYGYISIAELVENEVELDLYWQTQPMSEVKKECGK